jgi:ribokinase
MTGNKIVIVGSSNTDMIVKIPRIPGPGETILGGRFSMAAGGKGANQAVAAARAGGCVALIGCVGKDTFGEAALRGFVADGIDCAGVVKDSSLPSGIALIFVSESGENSIAVAPGANAALTAAHIESQRGVIVSARLLVLQLETSMEAVAAAAEIAYARGVRIILNPAPAAPVPADLLRRVDILTPNEHEAKVLTGMEIRDASGAARAADALMARGVGTVLITLGPQGVFVAAPGIREIVSGFMVDAVDTTGAGDVFNGALAVALGEGKPLLEAAAFANAAAALSVTRLGAQPSIPGRSEIDGFLAVRTGTSPDSRAG